MSGRTAAFVASLHLLASFVAGAASGADGTVALRATGRFFGDATEIGVRDLPRPEAEAALAAAWAALAAAEVEFESLNQQSAGQPAKLSPRLARELARAQGLCQWSDGAIGPLGAPVYRLWENGTTAAAIPPQRALDAAIEASRCDRMRVETSTAGAATLGLAPGSALDLRDFARGWAVDRAAEAMLALGASNFEVRLGAVARARGEGPDGRGWPWQPARFALFPDPVGPFLLRDQSAAALDPGALPIEIAGDRWARLFDLRSGRPTKGVAGVFVVSELAADAEPLAAAMAVFGATAGQLRLGSLRPRPSVLWLLGSPESGAPVLASANWSAVKRP